MNYQIRCWQRAPRKTPQLECMSPPKYPKIAFRAPRSTTRCVERTSRTWAPSAGSALPISGVSLQSHTTIMGTPLQTAVAMSSERREDKSTSLVVHFLHVGKTGGTAVKHALASQTSLEHRSLRLHDHSVRLMDVPKGEFVVFFVRDPTSRFVSGFNSRQRQGRPRYNLLWTAAEERAFSQFHTPNELAIALSAREPERRLAAIHAMNSIFHVKSSYWDWFHSETYLRSRLADLFFIGFQERLNLDFDVLKHKLKLPPSLVLPEDEIAAHRTPHHTDRYLAATARSNLRQWYAADYECVEICRDLAATINSQESTS